VNRSIRSSAEDKKKIFEGNALRAYPRLKSKLPRQGGGARVAGTRAAWISTFFCV
jgi:hypothetical protein